MSTRAQHVLAIVLAAVVVLPSLFFGGWTLLAAAARGAVSVSTSEQPYSCSDDSQTMKLDGDGEFTPVIPIDIDLDCTVTFTVTNNSLVPVSLESATDGVLEGTDWGVLAQTMAGSQTERDDLSVVAHFDEPIVVAPGDAYDFVVALAEWKPSCPSGEGWGSVFTAPSITASGLGIAGVLENEVGQYGFVSGTCSPY